MLEHRSLYFKYEIQELVARDDVLFVLDDSSLLADVHPVQELPDILPLDGCGLLDEGSRLGHGLDAVTCRNNKY